MRINVLFLCLVLAVGCSKPGGAVKDDVSGLDGYPLPAKRTALRANVAIGGSASWKYVIKDQRPEQIAEELRPALEKAGWTVTKTGPSELSHGGVEITSERAGKVYYTRVWWDEKEKQTVLDLEVQAQK